MPQALDIEKLCQWAYRDELSKRQTSSAEGVWDRIADFSVYQTTIDHSSPQRYDLGEPDPDAITIEAAVARLPDVALNWEREAWDVLGVLLALVDPRPKTNALAPTRTSSVAGWTNIRGERVSVTVRAPRQALLVRTLRPAALVTAHAAMGTRPDWFLELPQPQSVPSIRGHGATIVGECRGRNYYSTGSYCPLTWEPSPIAIAEARADYLAWWRSLGLLASMLRGQLRRFMPLAPACDEMPWK